MNILDEIRSRLSGRTVKIQEKESGKIYIEISPDDLMDFVNVLYNDLKMRFITASGIDTRNHLELIYHFTDDATGRIVSLKVFITDKRNPSISSLSGIFKAADWIEREIHELLGVNFIGHPNLKHLLLNDDWPKGNYPLRHDNE